MLLSCCTTFCDAMHIECSRTCDALNYPMLLLAVMLPLLLVLADNTTCCSPGTSACWSTCQACLSCLPHPLLQAAQPEGSVDVRQMRNSQGRTPAEVACSASHQACADLLDPSKTLASALSARGEGAAERRGPPTLRRLAAKTVNSQAIADLLLLEARARRHQAAECGAAAADTSAAAASSMATTKAVAAASEQQEARGAAVKAEVVLQLAESRPASVPCKVPAPVPAQEPHAASSPTGAHCKAHCHSSSPGCCPAVRSCSAPLSGEAVKQALAGLLPVLEVEPETEDCGICFDTPEDIKIKGCGHKLCLGCAKRLYTGTSSAVVRYGVHCPFCRGSIGGFEGC